MSTRAFHCHLTSGLGQSWKIACVAHGIQEQHLKTSQTKAGSIPNSMVESLNNSNKASRVIFSHLLKTLRNKHGNSRAMK